MTTHQQQWWDAARIDATVTKAFVCQQLVGDEIQRLDKPVASFDGLTNGTYWDWIEKKAKRIFLILADLNVPDQIFNLIDDSWCDEELPIGPDGVERLCLTAHKDERIERRFFQRQFAYLLKPLQRGDHHVYGESELVPLDVVDRKPGLGGSPLVDKVTLYNHPNMVFWRRRIPLGAANSACMSQAEFQEAVDGMRSSQNAHIVSYWASYIHQGSGYVLFTPASDFNLKSFLATQPACFKILPKKQRKELVMNWILCLTDTLCYLHSRTRSHCYIKPSTILFNNRNHIFFSDSSRFSPESLTGQQDKNSFDREWYDYAAPEQWFRPTSGPTSPPSRKATLSSSPENQLNILIPRTEHSSYSPNAMLQTPNPHLNPQSADIFSLGCIILEFLSFLLKKQQKFASHRAAKHKTPGRGGAVPDSSFHKNLGQVEGWMSEMAKEATKKANDRDSGDIFKGITPMLHVVARMLSANPHDRPSAHEVQQRVYQILIENCHIAEPHCVHQYGFEFGFSQLIITPSQSETVTIRPPTRHSGQFSPRTAAARPTHIRTNSSGGLSNNSASSTSSSEKDRELMAGFASIRNIRVPNQRVRSPEPWQPAPGYAGSNDQAAPATVY